MAFSDSNITPPKNPRGGQLVVANIPTTVIEREHLDRQGWWYKCINDKHIWVTSTCSRVLMVTTKEYWEDNIAARFPELTSRAMNTEEAKKIVEGGESDPFATEHPFFRKEVGWNAYQYLLECCCGLHSHDLGEEHVLHQILEQSYNAHKRTKNNNLPTWFDHVVDDLKHDARQVRNVIGVHIVPTEEDTARELAGLSQHKPVLVITDDWESTQRMIYALGRDSAPMKPKQIDIVHISPQSDSLDKLQLQCDKMHELYKVLPPTNVDTLDSILAMGPDWLRDYEAIFILSPLNKHSAQEEKLVSAWHACGTERPKLVALRLDPANEMGIMPLAEFKSDSKAVALLPDKVGEAFEYRRKEHAALLKQGNEACALVRKLRQESGGQHKPRGADLTLGYENYTEKSRQLALPRLLLHDVIEQKRAKESQQTQR